MKLALDQVKGDGAKQAGKGVKSAITERGQSRVNMTVGVVSQGLSLHSLKILDKIVGTF